MISCRGCVKNKDCVAKEEAMALEEKYGVRFLLIYCESKETE